MTEPGTTTSEGKRIEHDVADRVLVLITHANPEDNQIARWLAARLAALGYRVWVDLRNLRGGEDFWQAIERTLRHHARKQIVLVSQHIRKQGVQKELALGDLIGRQLEDDAFMIPVRIDDVSFSDLPTELLRRNTINGHPNWASMLDPILETLEDGGVQRHDGPQVDLLEQIIEAQEDGKRVIRTRSEVLFSNWFPVTSMPDGMRFFGPKASRDQFDAWLGTVQAPFVEFQRIAGTFCDQSTFEASGPNNPTLQERFFIPTDRLIAGGRGIDPFSNRDTARRHVVNLMRQHWDHRMRNTGLEAFEFSNGQTGWFFPDGLIQGSIKATGPDGRKIDRVLSGKFKDRRWHLCIVANPRLWPEPLLRVHANLVLTEDGKTPLPGEATQRLRRRLTRSWFNDKWRDMLLAAMNLLADGKDTLDLSVGDEQFELACHPTMHEIGVSYDANETRTTEEDDAGEIVLGEELDTSFDTELDLTEEEGDD